jgi:predicted solute-binding protein
MPSIYSIVTVNNDTGWWEEKGRVLIMTKDSKTTVIYLKELKYCNRPRPRQLSA